MATLKTLVSVAALATLITASASAQSVPSSPENGNGRQNGQVSRPGKHPHDVFVGERLIGRDPDSTMRMQLQHGRSRHPYN
jgi:hypothetical protein